MTILVEQGEFQNETQKELFDIIIDSLSLEARNSLFASYGLRYNRRINENAVDPTAHWDNRYYNSPLIV